MSGMGLPKILLIALMLPTTVVIITIIKWHTLDLPRLEEQQPSYGDLQGVPQNVDVRLDPDRQTILELLQDAGFHPDIDPRFTKELFNSLPKWSDVLNLYGKPRIIGLETCKAYRDSVPEAERALAPAGNFNSGTNLLQELIQRNCLGPSTWQVPWGKHWPAIYRESNIVKGSGGTVKYDRVMPVISVRDPYTWMQSQCRQPYEARFDHNKSTCPNIIPYDTDIIDHPRYAHKKYVPVRVHYRHEPPPKIMYKHQSLAHFWNNWNDEYVFNRTSSFPRLIIRMEDLVFHPKEVIPQICECVGFKTKEKIHHKKDVANYNRGIDKDTSQGAGLLRSVIRYGDPMSRRKGYTPCQLWAAKDVLDPRLMETFGYKYEDRFGPDPKVWENCFAYYTP